MNLKGEALHQNTFLKYLELRKVLVIANVNENIWSGIIRRWVVPASLATRIIASIEAKMKLLGKKKGIPDIFIPLGRGEYNGMYVEMKFGRNKTTKEQDFWLRRLSKLNYYCVVCYSSQEAIKEFEKYEKGK